MTPHKLTDLAEQLDDLMDELTEAVATDSYTEASITWKEPDGSRTTLTYSHGTLPDSDDEDEDDG